jgi:hypothetical protein
VAVGPKSSLTVSTLPKVEVPGVVRRLGRPATKEDRRESIGGHPQCPRHRRWKCQGWHKVRVSLLWRKTIGESAGQHGCDRSTSKMRGLSPKIILGDSRWIENAQTHTNKHTIPNMIFKLKLLQIKCHVLGFTKDKAQDVLQKIIRVCGSIRLSR